MMILPLYEVPRYISKCSLFIQALRTVGRPYYIVVSAPNERIGIETGGKERARPCHTHTCARRSVGYERAQATVPYL